VKISTNASLCIFVVLKIVSTYANGYLKQPKL
jgi:hypothetical protein